MRTWTQRYFLSASDREDLWQIARFALWQAAQSYRLEAADRAPFRAWARLMVWRRVQDAVRYTQRTKRWGSMAPLSLDAPLSSEGFALGDQVAASGGDPERAWVTREGTQDLTTALAQTLTDLEWRVFCTMLRTRSLQQTAQHLQLPYRRVDNAVQRIRHKARHVITPHAATADQDASPRRR